MMFAEQMMKQKMFFSYATNKGIEIIIPDNVLKSRNVLRQKRKAVAV